MSLLSKLFPPSKWAVKRSVARELHGALVKVPEGHRVVVSQMRGWEVVLDVDSPAGPPSLFFGAPPATRIGVPFQPQDDFTLDLVRRGLVGQAIYDRRKKSREDEATREAGFREIQPRLSAPDLDLGYGEFDYEFSFETNDEQKLREFLADKEMRQLLQGHRSVHLIVAREDEWLESLGPSTPQNTAILYFREPAIVKDVGRIKAIHHLLIETMDRLVNLRSASPVPPRLFRDPGPSRKVL